MNCSDNLTISQNLNLLALINTEKMSDLQVIKYEDSVKQDDIKDLISSTSTEKSLPWLLDEK